MVMATPLTDTSETNHNFKERRFLENLHAKINIFFGSADKRRDLRLKPEFVSGWRGVFHAFK